MTAYSKYAEFAVFGPGWGQDQLADGFGSGNLAYRGESLTEAWRVLDAERAAVAKMRRRPDMKAASDTYAVFGRIGPRWQNIDDCQKCDNGKMLRVGFACRECGRFYGTKY